MTPYPDQACEFKPRSPCGETGRKKSPNNLSSGDYPEASKQFPKMSKRSLPQFTDLSESIVGLFEKTLLAEG
jgi:hypothetical protein